MAGTRYRIWHVGSEDVRMRIPLLEALKARGFSVGAVGSEDDAPFQQAGIPYRRYSLNRWINPVADRRSMTELTRLFREFQPDIVHGFDTKPAMLAMHAAKAAGVPGRVRTITGMGYVFSSRSPIALILRYVYRLLQRRASMASSMTIFQNEDDRDYFLRHEMVAAEKSCLVRGSGINVDEFRASVPSDDDLLLLREELGIHDHAVVTMITRMVANKGVYEFLECARHIGKTHKNTKFLLVGPLVSEGHQAVSINTIKKYSDVASYLGRRNDVPAILAISDVVVLPSHYREGVPRVLLEAAALGKPIVTTNMPGCRDVVRHGDNGLLVPIRDSAALAAAVQRLLGAPDMRRNMGERGAALVKREFDLSLVADAYAAIYRNVLSR